MHHELLTYPGQLIARTLALAQSYRLGVETVLEAGSLARGGSQLVGACSGVGIRAGKGGEELLILARRLFASQ